MKIWFVNHNSFVMTNWTGIYGQRPMQHVCKVWDVISWSNCITISRYLLSRRQEQPPEMSGLKSTFSRPRRKYGATANETDGVQTPIRNNLHTPRVSVVSRKCFLTRDMPYRTPHFTQDPFGQGIGNWFHGASAADNTDLRALEDKWRPAHDTV